MSRREIFISYSHKDQSSVAGLLDQIEKYTIQYWYDGFIADGNFSDTIEARIRDDSVGFIAILTESSAGPRASGWCNEEIKLARDNLREENILLVRIGDFKMHRDLKATVYGLHVFGAPSLQALPDMPGFQARMKRFEDLCAGRPPRDVADLMRELEGVDAVLPETVEQWYSGPPPVEDQSLALAVAALGEAPVEYVMKAAQMLKEQMEDRLRALTEEEQKALPRTIGGRSRSERLKAVRARIATDRDPETGCDEDFVRFEDSSWRHDLLEHIWTERDDVRAVFLDWIKGLIETRGQGDLGVIVAQSLGQIAQRRFEQVRFLVLEEWVREITPENFQARRAVLGQLLSSAVADRRNVDPTVALLDRLVERDGGAKAHELTYGHCMALAVALGPLGLAEPEIGLHMMRKFGRRVFFPEDRLFDVGLRDIACLSPAIQGAKAEPDAPQDGEEPAETPEPKTAQAETEPATSEEAPEPADTEGKEAPADKGLQGVAGEDNAWGASAALPAASFLAALGDWADEPARDQQAKGRRQVPLFALMVGVSHMPVYSHEYGSWLTIEDLMIEIDTREPGIVDAIARGLTRASVATRYGETAYLPRGHLKDTFRFLARRRKQERKRLARKGKLPGDGTDPFIVFAARIHDAIRRKHGEAAEFVIEGCSAYLTDEELSAVRSGETRMPSRRKEPVE